MSSHWDAPFSRGARVVYTALLCLLQPAYLLRFLWRSWAEPLYRMQLSQRWGYYAKGTDPGSMQGCLWVHAVSLGETRAAAPLMQALRLKQPGLRLLLTHSTATGWQAGRELLLPGDAQAWLPIDTPSATALFFQHFRPAMGVLIETEIWPNLLRQAQRRGVPMVLANARLSERSLRKGLRLQALLQPAVQSLGMILAQSEADAQRFIQAGASKEQVQVCGNIKFDMAPNPEQLASGRQAGQSLQRPVVLAASTREGEENLLLHAWKQQLSTIPAGQPVPLLLLVPRHPQRFEEVVRLVQSHNVTLVRRSQLQGISQESVPAGVAVVVGDTVGEMPFYYAMADVALLGGSFAPLGGQNLIEAAVCGCVVVMGPHTFNFALASELALAAGAALRVGDLSAAVSVASALARSHTQAALSQSALAFAEQHRGAAQRMADLIHARNVQSPTMSLAGGL